MTKTIENLFYFFHVSTDVLIILLFLVFLKKVKKEGSFTAIAFYSLVDLGLNFLPRHFSQSFGLYIWSTFTFFEYSIFTYVIWKSIKRQTIRKAITVISVLFVVFTTIYNISTNFKKIDSIPIGIETILILVYSFYFLYEQMNDTNNLFIYSRYQFWLVAGFMIYLAGSFFVFIFASGLERETLAQYWFLTNGFYSFMDLLFAISFLAYVKKPKNIYSKGLNPYLN
jgi:hypothetical protein